MKKERNISEYNKTYRLNNAEYFILKNKEFHDLNKESIAERKRNYYLENKENICQRQKKYYSKNKKSINKQTVKHINDRKEYDDLFKLKSNIRGLIASSIRLKGYKKHSKTNEILGCSFEEFKIYLESKFEIWMNWNNYGNWNGCSKEPNISWDIIILFLLSNATNEEEIMKLNYYTNLQPLCSYMNRHIKAGKNEAA